MSVLRIIRMKYIYGAFLDNEQQQTASLLLLCHLLNGIPFMGQLGKQNSPRCDAAERGVPSVAILFA